MQIVSSAYFLGKKEKKNIVNLGSAELAERYCGNLWSVSG